MDIPKGRNMTGVGGMANRQVHRSKDGRIQLKTFQALHNVQIISSHHFTVLNILGVSLVRVRTASVSSTSHTAPTPSRKTTPMNHTPHANLPAQEKIFWTQESHNTLSCF